MARQATGAADAAARRRRASAGVRLAAVAEPRQRRRRHLAALAEPAETDVLRRRVPGGVVVPAWGPPRASTPTTPTPRNAAVDEEDAALQRRIDLAADSGAEGSKRGEARRAG